MTTTLNEPIRQIIITVTKTNIEMNFNGEFAVHEVVGIAEVLKHGRLDYVRSKTTDCSLEVKKAKN